MSDLAPAKQAALKMLIERPSEYENYFFQKAKGLDIFAPLRDAGFFNADRNPRPVPADKPGYFQIPEWPALQYLQRAAEEAVKQNRDDYLEEILGIVRAVTDASTKNGTDNYRTWRHFAQLFVVIPSKLLNKADIQLLEIWLNSRFSSDLVADVVGSKLLPKLLASGTAHDKELCVEVEKCFLIIKWEEAEGIQGRRFTAARSPVDTYWLVGLWKKNAAHLGSICGFEAVTPIASCLLEFCAKTQRCKYSAIWRPAIEDHEQNKEHYQTVEDVLVTALRDVSESAVLKNPVSGRIAIREWLKSDNVLLVRIGLHLVNTHFILLAGPYWELISLLWFDDSFRHEHFRLLDTHFAKFDAEQQRRILGFIESLPHPGGDDQYNEKRIAAAKLRWLQAINGKGSSEADAKYAEYTTTIGGALPHPEFSVYHEEGWVGRNSPVSVEELFDLSPAQLQTFLAEFKSADRMGGANQQGLSDTLKSAAETDPIKFARYLDSILDAKPRHISSVVEGMAKAWGDEKEIPWDDVLGFCEKLVASTEFWIAAEPSSNTWDNGSRGWIISSIADLFKAATKLDSHAVPPEFNPRMEGVIATILDREAPGLSADDDDPLQGAINTPKGRTVEALIHYSLRAARLENQVQQHHVTFWTHIEPLFNKLLDELDNRNFEVSAILGNSLPYLAFLSHEWLISNFPRIFPLDSDANWYAAMTGYSYTSVVYEESYQLLKDGKHFQRAISAQYREKKIYERVLDQVTLYFLIGKESLGGAESVFRQMLERWEVSDISHMTWFLWTNRDPSDKARSSRVLEFWRWVDAKAKTDKDNEAEILSDLCQLIAFISEIGPIELELLKRCSPHVERKWHGTFFLEDLQRLVPEYSEEVAAIMMIMIEGEVPTYPAEAVVAIVSQLFVSGFREEANAICNKYSSSGSDILAELYKHPPAVRD